MISRTVNLAAHWAVLCASLVILAAPDAQAKSGCSATCAKGACSTSNTYAECGCCTDGTPYCGSASNCSAHTGTTFASITFDVVSVGGEASATHLVEVLNRSLQPTEGSAKFVASVDALWRAILSGNTEEAQAAQLITIERFDGLAEGDGLVALKVALDSLSSPGAR